MRDQKGHYKGGGHNDRATEKGAPRAVLMTLKDEDYIGLVAFLSFDH